MQSKLITLPISNVILVLLPEGAIEPFVAKTYIDEDGHTYDTNPQWVEWSGTFPNNTINLPSGNWRIIGMLSEVTEGQAAGIVDDVSFKYPYLFKRKFEDYSCEAENDHDTTIESLESAILAEGWYFENPYKSKPDINDYRNEWGGNMVIDPSDREEWLLNNDEAAIKELIRPWPFEFQHHRTVRVTAMTREETNYPSIQDPI